MFIRYTVEYSENMALFNKKWCIKDSWSNVKDYYRTKKQATEEALQLNKDNHIDMMDELDLFGRL